MQVYLDIAKRAFQQQLAYRTSNLGGLATNTFWGVLRSFLFLSLFQGREVAAGWRTGGPMPLSYRRLIDAHIRAPDAASGLISPHVPRRTNQYGCVTLHSYHFALNEGSPHTQVLLWVSDQQLRAPLSMWCWQNTAASMIGGIAGYKHPRGGILS